MKAAKTTYSSFIGLIKIAIPVLAILTAVIIALIS